MANDYVERLNSLSQEQLKKLVLDSAQKVGSAHEEIKKKEEVIEQKNKQLLQKDKLIADFTSQKERSKREAEYVITKAKEQAKQIEANATKLEEAAKKHIQECEEEIARKLSNANAQADSIVESRLTEAKNEIERIETQREEAKRSAIALNKNIIDKYNTLIEDVEKQISSFKDMQQNLSDFSIEIEAEDFKKFNMEDYVTTSSRVKTSSSTSKTELSVKPIIDVDNDDTDLNDIDLDNLAYIFDEEEDLADMGDDFEETDGPELLSDDDLAYLQEDFDFDTEFDIEDNSSDDLDDFTADDDLFSDGTMKSFTDSFMAVRSSDDDDDLDDIDIESILDDDDDVDEETAVSETPKVNIPARRRRRSSKNNNGSRWI